MGGQNWVPLKLDGYLIYTMHELRLVFIHIYTIKCRGTMRYPLTHVLPKCSPYYFPNFRSTQSEIPNLQTEVPNLTHSEEVCQGLISRSQ